MQCPQCWGLSPQVCDHLSQLRYPRTLRQTKIHKYFEELATLASLGLGRDVKPRCLCAVQFEPKLTPAQLVELAALVNFLDDNRSCMAKAQEKTGAAWLKNEECRGYLTDKESGRLRKLFMLGAGDDHEALCFILPEEFVGPVDREPINKG